MWKLELFILSEFKKKRDLPWRVSLSDCCGKENRSEGHLTGRVVTGEGNKAEKLLIREMLQSR